MVSPNKALQTPFQITDPSQQAGQPLLRPGDINWKRLRTSDSEPWLLICLVCLLLQLQTPFLAARRIDVQKATAILLPARLKKITPWSKSIWAWSPSSITLVVTKRFGLVRELPKVPSIYLTKGYHHQQVMTGAVAPSGPLQSTIQTAASGQQGLRFPHMSSSRD